MAESIKAYLKAGRTIADYLRDNSMPVTETGCWLWLGTLDEGGYGRICFNGRNIGAHRLALETFVGTVPEGLVIDHLCRVRCCINVAHMEPVTNGENIRRGISHYGERSHCEAGHPYTAENTAINKAYDSRQCRICKRISNQKYKAAHRAELAELRRQKNKAEPETHRIQQHEAYIRRKARQQQETK